MNSMGLIPLYSMECILLLSISNGLLPIVTGVMVKLKREDRVIPWGLGTSPLATSEVFVGNFFIDLRILYSRKFKASTLGIYIVEEFTMILVCIA